MDIAGLRRSTVAKYLRLLRDAGLLGLVETGTTPQFRSFLHRLEGNRAAVYVLCVPAPASSVEETRTPSRSPGYRVQAPKTQRICGRGLPGLSLGKYVIVPGWRGCAGGSGTRWAGTR